MKFEVFVTVTTEKTYAFTVDADDTQDAVSEARDALEGADVSEIFGVREITGWTWLCEEIDRVVPVSLIDPVPADPVCRQCPTCVEHPGWAHADESRRNEPSDVCRACFGSGINQNVDLCEARTLYDNA